MAWWTWVLGGLVLLVAEVTTPGGSKSYEITKVRFV